MKYLLTLLLCVAFSGAHANETTEPVWLVKIEGCNVYKFRIYGELENIYLTVCDNKKTAAITKG